MDLKTSTSRYEECEVALSDQFSAYEPEEPTAKQTALCVLVKTKEPKVEWNFSQRPGPQLTGFLAKAEYVAHEISAGCFHKRLGAPASGAPGATTWRCASDRRKKKLWFTSNETTKSVAATLLAFDMNGQETAAPQVLSRFGCDLS